MTESQMIASPKRVLVVDNDPHVVKSVPFNLKMAGYQVITAQSSDEALILMKREIIHLAIIDIRLEDEKNEEFSGFELAKHVPSYIPFIIYTAYEDSEIIKLALTEVGAKASIDKKAPQSARKIIETVNRLFASDVKVKFDLEIHDSLHFDILARQIQAPDVATELLPTQDDVRQILQTLFYEATAVKVAFLLPWEAAPTRTQSGSVLVKVEPQFKPGWATPVVVKFSAKDEIEHEARNYAIIEPFLGGARRADFRGAAYSRQIGGLVYSLIDAENLGIIHVFDDVFLQGDTERVIELLKRFFNQTFKQLFQDARREPIDLTARYTRALHLTPEKLRMAIEEFHAGILSEPQVRFKGLQGAFPNPVMWALPNGQFRRFEVISRVCLCHGDLHSRNILVDGSGNFWLIDFARVAESHALRDFAELETDIKFNLLPVVDLAALLRFEQALLASAHFEDPPPTGSFGNDRLDHAYRVVLALRHIASELIDLQGDMREYYQALFFHTLNIMRLRPINVNKKEHALLSAALICQRLDNWPEWQAPQLSTVPSAPDTSKPRDSVQSPDSKMQEVGKGRPSWGVWLLGGGIFFLLGAAVVALWPPVQSINPNLVGAGAFLLLGVGVVALLWWAMQSFRPTWQQHMATLLYLSVIIIAAFALLGLVSGTTAIEALQSITSNLLPKH